MEKQKKKQQRVVQLLPTMAFGDAVGNDTLSIAGILENRGFQKEIYAENIDRRFQLGVVKTIDRMEPLSDDDILIYHASTGTELNYMLPNYGGKQVMIYHNITPPEFFEGYSPIAADLCRNGYEGIQHLSEIVKYCIADSEYNKQELIAMGYRCPIDVCPILIPFDDYNQTPDHRVVSAFCGDGYTNLLFVGRIAPNKKQEDVIRAFYIYQRYFNSKSRLFLVGSSSGMEKYEQKLHAYVEKLGISSKVIFPGHIRFSEILAYYRIADAFVCMSEHEGFCVPIVEAMHFDIPIIAYNSSAVPETMAKGGIIIEDKDPQLAATAIDRVIRDQNLRKYISDCQKDRLKDFSYDSVQERFMECMKKVL